jgi:hypothetical protein
MPTIFLNEQEAGGPATGVAYPNLRSCVGVTAVLLNQTMVGGHMTAADDIDRLTARMITAIGTEGIRRLYLIGGYTLMPGEIHGGDQAAHARAVALALAFHGQVWSFDTAALAYMGALVILDNPTLTGDVRVQYKNWAKLKPVTTLVDGPHPYKPRGVPIITTDVSRLPKWYDKNPSLILHELAISKFSIIDT